VVAENTNSNNIGFVAISEESKILLTGMGGRRTLPGGGVVASTNSP